jgi:hypothetical protein
MPPLPGSPVKFSGLMDRVCAAERRERVPMPMPSPLNAAIVVSPLLPEYISVGSFVVDRDPRDLFVTSLPVLPFSFAAQRYIIGVMTAGAVKG